ncbi:MAG: sporulation protein YtfJ [Clostridia bacterium]|nr:sporulation protein YtfJ [Clostridia bacterium]
MSENKMTEIIRASIDSIKSSFDANTVTGDPITTANGTVIIPVSKLSVGFATGGVDYLGKNNPKPAQSNFGGGGGTGVTVTPVAFIVVAPNGNVEMLSIANPAREPQDPVSQIISAIERSPELIEKLKEVFSKKKDSSSAE